MSTDSSRYSATNMEEINNFLRSIEDIEKRREATNYLLGSMSVYLNKETMDRCIDIARRNLERV